MIGKGEAPLRGRRCCADRLDRTAQAAEDLTDGNQLAALTLHGFYSPMFLRQDFAGDEG